MSEQRTYDDWREARRFRAWELKQEGWLQKDIAEALGVSKGAVSQWMQRAREGGVEALRNRKGGGPDPRLSAEELQQLPDLLAKGPEAYGFRGDVWTRARVNEVLKEEFDVSYSLGHISRLLDEIGWTQQKPQEQASQRDDEAVEAWRTERWSELKKKPNEKSAPSSS